MLIKIPSYIVPIIITIVLFYYSLREQRKGYFPGTDKYIFLLYMFGVAVTWIAYFVTFYFIK